MTIKVKLPPDLKSCCFFSLYLPRKLFPKVEENPKNNQCKYSEGGQCNYDEGRGGKSGSRFCQKFYFNRF